MRLDRIVLFSGLVLLLSACGGTSQPVRSASSKPVKVATAQPVRPAMRYRPRNPQVLSAPGLEGVIGVDEGALTRQFGPPRLNVWEGDARKLQWVGPACVLDVFLYPGEAGGTPQATYLETRRASDGADVDRAGCVAALRKL